MADKGSLSAYVTEMASEIQTNTTHSTTSQQLQDNYRDLADTTQGLLDEIYTAIGISEGDTALGTFTGSTINDGSTVADALQALETAVESVGSGATNLSASYTTGQVVVASDTGTDATIATATTTTAGCMSAAQATKLSYITVGDFVNLNNMEDDIADHQAVLGVVDGSTTMGTFTGSWMTDNTTLKALLQKIETFVETLSGGAAGATLTKTSASDYAWQWATKNAVVIDVANDYLAAAGGDTNTAISAAVTAANALSTVVVLKFDARLWTVSSVKTITNAYGVYLDFLPGSTMTTTLNNGSSAIGNACFKWTGTIGSYSSLGADVARNDNFITCAGLAGSVSEQTIMYVRSQDDNTEVHPHTYGLSGAATWPGESHVVKSVSTNDIYFQDFLIDDMTTANSAEACVVNAIQGGGIRGLTLVSSGTNSNTFCYTYAMRNFLIQDVWCKVNSSGGIVMTLTVDAKIERYTVDGFYDEFQYGLVVAGGCRNIVWDGGTYRGPTHPMTTTCTEGSGGSSEKRWGHPIWCTFRNLTIYQEKHGGLDMHPEGWGFRFEDCTIFMTEPTTNYNPGAQIRGRMTWIERCKFFGNSLVNTNASNACIKVYGPYCHIHNCWCQGSWYGIQIATNPSGINPTDIDINDCDLVSNASAGILMNLSGGVRIRRNRFIDNGTASGSPNWMGLYMASDVSALIFQNEFYYSANQTVSIQRISSGTSASAIRENIFWGYAAASNSGTGLNSFTDHATLAGESYNHVVFTT